MTEPPKYAVDPLAGLLKLELVSLRGDPLFVSYGYRAMSLFTYALTKGEFLNDYETLPYLARFLSRLLRFSRRDGTSVRPKIATGTRVELVEANQMTGQTHAAFDCAATIVSA